MIMGHVHSRMTGVEITGDMIVSSGEARKIECLVFVDIVNWDHVDRRDKPVLAIEREERASGQCFENDINYTEAREKVGEVDQRAHFLIALRLRDLPIIYMLGDSPPVMINMLTGVPRIDSWSVVGLRVGREHGHCTRCEHGDKHGGS